MSALQTSQALNISTYGQMKNELIVKPNARIELKYLPPAAARLTFPAFFQPSNEDNVPLQSRRYGEWPEKWMRSIASIFYKNTTLYRGLRVIPHFLQ